MARALALTAECLDCTQKRLDGSLGGGLPNIIAPPPTDLPSSGGGTVIPPEGQRPVTVGTSEIPSSGPTLQRPPEDTPTAPAAADSRWREVWLVVGVVVALLLIAAPQHRGRDE